MERNALDEVILFAIRKEAEAANLYEIYADLALAKNVKHMFRELKKEELEHKSLLENIKSEDVSSYMFTNVPDMKIAHYLSEGEFSRDMAYPDALLLAIKREEKSYQLYQDLAFTTRNDKLKKLFLVLASEEAKHKLKLEDEYDKTVLTES